MTFNRKERLQIAKKIKGQHGMRRRPSNKNVSWRLLNSKKRLQREKEAIEELESRSSSNGKFAKNDEERSEAFGEEEEIGEELSHQQPTSTAGKQRTWYSLCVALPGSILNNVQTNELKSYVTGELARTFAIFCVAEVIVFDETARMTESQLNSYYSGDWTGEERMHAGNVESVFYMARILEFLECPQYLRRMLFPFQKPLQFSALLNPLNSMHHLSSTDLDFPFREGIILDKQSKRGLLCDVGLERELLLDTDHQIPPYTRVTVRIKHQQQPSKRLYGSLVSSRIVREEIGTYWGYTVKITKSLSELFDGSYDCVIGTSERGNPIQKCSLPPKTNKICKILVVFGGLNGLEAAIESDQSLQGTDPTKLFPSYLNCLPDQGSRVIRTEEAIPITLTSLKSKLDGN